MTKDGLSPGLFLPRLYKDNAISGSNSYGFICRTPQGPSLVSSLCFGIRNRRVSTPNLRLIFFFFR